MVEDHPPSRVGLGAHDHRLDEDLPVTDRLAGMLSLSELAPHLPQGSSVDAQLAVRRQTWGERND
jgi:hypothetical protein